MLCDYVHGRYAPDVVHDTMDLSITVKDSTRRRKMVGMLCQWTAALRSVTRMTYSITFSAATGASTTQLALGVRSEITADPLCA